MEAQGTAMGLLLRKRCASYSQYIIPAAMFECLVRVADQGAPSIDMVSAIEKENISRWAAAQGITPRTIGADYLFHEITTTKKTSCHGVTCKGTNVRRVKSDYDVRLWNTCGLKIVR